MGPRPQGLPRAEGGYLEGHAPWEEAHESPGLEGCRRGGTPCSEGRRRRRRVGAGDGGSAPGRRAVSTRGTEPGVQ